MHFIQAMKTEKKSIFETKANYFADECLDRCIRNFSKLLSSKERCRFRIKSMNLIVRSGFLYNYFPQHETLFSYFAVIQEIP